MSYGTQTADVSSPIYPQDVDDAQHEEAFAKRRCCFCFPFLSNTRPSSPSRSGSVFWQRINDPVENSCSTTPTPTADDAWWERGWKRIREWSEVVAGPKWKTFLRKFSKKRKNYAFGNGKFRYDPLSYALNFDEGPTQNGHFDEDIVGREFSSRYSLPPSRKTSLDFDKEGIVGYT